MSSLGVHGSFVGNVKWLIIGARGLPNIRVSEQSCVLLSSLKRLTMYMFPERPWWKFGRMLPPALSMPTNPPGASCRGLKALPMQVKVLVIVVMTMLTLVRCVTRSVSSSGGWPGGAE